MTLFVRQLFGTLYFVVVQEIFPMVLPRNAGGGTKRTLSSSLQELVRYDSTGWMRIGVASLLLGLFLTYVLALQFALHDAQVKQNHPLAVTRKQKPLLQRKDAAIRAHDAVAQHIVTLSTTIGPIQIVLRPDLSFTSVQYILNVTSSCRPCNFYRAEKPGILQGILQSSNAAIDTSTIQKGPCPIGAETVANDCPAWDAQCGCHGPVMTHGMVAWAAGATGPDFFINAYSHGPATWWGTQHTVWGEIQDEHSFHTMERIWTLPVHEGSGMRYLNEPLHIDMSVETVASAAAKSVS
jgi:Cyclophilin type peptidyl-prolyl cis-trans isomerase/CLD